MYSIKALVLLALIGYAKSKVVNFWPCEVNDCEISEVRVEPCIRANDNAACNIRRRKPFNMAFDFTANFDADTLDASLVWVMDSHQELPLISVSREACKYTTCPIRSGVNQTYKVDIPIENKFPLHSYNIKWTFKEPNGKQCCFWHGIKLVRY